MTYDQMARDWRADQELEARCRAAETALERVADAGRARLGKRVRVIADAEQVLREMREEIIRTWD